MNITKKIKKIYKISNNNELIVLNDINLKINKNNFYGIIGHSGSGKSTLIHILGLLDNYSDGEYFIDNINIKELNEDDKAHLRMQKFGFVFQAFYLNPKLSALENVMVPMLINKDIPAKDRKKIATIMLEKLGLGNRLNHKPSQLSGGEQQRVAIARALVNNPDIIIADEPTGNLDKENELMVFEILKELVEKEKKCVIVVSHNNLIKEYADKIFILEDGILKEGLEC